MLTTLQALPEVDERTRFGTVVLGYDKIMTMRREVWALQRLAAFACNCEVTDLTMEKIEALINELQQTQTGA